MRTEDLDAALPERLLPGGLHHVGAVEVQEDRAQRVHLVAVSRPAPTHQLEKREGVVRLVSERIERRVDVALALVLQAIVEAFSHVL